MQVLNKKKNVVHTGVYKSRLYHVVISYRPFIYQGTFYIVINAYVVFEILSDLYTRINKIVHIAQP